jgi:hypothetical protein
MLDAGVGGIAIRIGHPFQVNAEKVEELRNDLLSEL